MFQKAIQKTLKQRLPNRTTQGTLGTNQFQSLNKPNNFNKHKKNEDFIVAGSDVLNLN